MTNIIPYVADFYHGDNPNFSALKAAGIVGVIHKATQGSDFVDPEYETRKPLAEAKGLLWAAYHFMDTTDVSAQVDLFLKTVGSDVRLILDWEEPPVGASPTQEQALEFLTQIQNQTGQIPWLYGSSLIRTNLPDTFAQFPLWLAEYGPIAHVPLPWKKYVLWQYTDVGSIAGDLSTFDGTNSQLANLWNLTVTQAA